jgi:Fe-S cluster assembly protein SufD
MKMALTAQQKQVLADHARFSEAVGSGGPAWLASLRHEAIERFAALGFPTSRHEEWKYTSVLPLARAGFRPANGSVPATADLSGLEIPGWECAQLVFVNGTFAAHLSRLELLPGEVSAGSLASKLESVPGDLEPHLARHAPFQGQAFTALNTAFLRDGAFVRIPSGLERMPPIHLLFLSVPGDEPVVSHPRSLILVGEGSRLSLFETHASAGEGAYWSNAVTEVVAAPRARIEHTRVQREGTRGHHVSTVQVRVERDAGYTSHAVMLGGALVRNDLNVVLEAEGSECGLNGLYVARDEQHVDNHTLVDHASPHGSSRELYKGILDGRAHGVFNGKVVVRKDAQKTDAQQTNKNLLLSGDALVDTKPQLEIFADDVKCTHGATVGQMDRDALFYLRARGVDAGEARRLLIRAFAAELVDRIPSEPFRGCLAGALEQQLSRFGPEDEA